MTHDRLLDEISSEEIEEWLAVDRIEPPVDHYLIGGAIASAIHNAMGSSKKVVRPSDIFPHLQPPPQRKMTTPEMRARFDGIAKRVEKVGPR